MIGVAVPLCEVCALQSAVSVVGAGVCLALRRRRRSDRGGRSGELDPRGADHCRNAVGTSTGAVFQRRHQVDYITPYWRQRAEERLGDPAPMCNHFFAVPLNTSQPVNNVNCISTPGCSLV